MPTEPPEAEGEEDDELDGEDQRQNDRLRHEAEFMLHNYLEKFKSNKVVDLYCEVR